MLVSLDNMQEVEIRMMKGGCMRGSRRWGACSHHPIDSMQRRRRSGLDALFYTPPISIIIS